MIFCFLAQLVNFPPAALRGLLSAAKFSSSSFSLLYRPSSLSPILHSGGRPVTRRYRNAMTRKWNVLSRAVIHLFYLTSLHTAVGAEIAISGGFLGLNALYPRHLHPRGESPVSYGFLGIIFISVIYTMTLSRLIKIRFEDTNGTLVIARRRVIAYLADIERSPDILFRTSSVAFSEMETYNAGGSRVAANNVTCSRNNDVSHSSFDRAARRSTVIFAALIRQSFINPTSCPVLRRRGGIIIV